MAEIRRWHENRSRRSEMTRPDMSKVVAMESETGEEALAMIDGVEDDL